MRAGDIIFVRGKTPLSKIINHFDGEFSHVAIALNDTHVLESEYLVNTVVSPMTFEDYEIVRLPISEEQEVQLLREAISLVGRRYDYTQIASYMIRTVHPSMRSFIINNPKNLICSETVSILLSRIGVVPEDNNITSLTPNELYGYLQTLRTVMFLQQAMLEK